MLNIVFHTTSEIKIVCMKKENKHFYENCIKNTFLIQKLFFFDDLKALKASSRICTCAKTF